MIATSLDPFVKWAGGKRWLVQSGKLCRPVTFNNYFEPFLGGGAVFFSLQPTGGVVSDINSELINFYRVLRDHPALIRDAMAYHQERHSRAYYYAIRASEPVSSIERAGRFLYLNRTCFNGLYRVNRRGAFNVPIGSRSRVMFENDRFEDAAAVLKRVDILCKDFEPVIDQAEDGDFIFVDPPYTVNHNMNGFLRYNELIFSWQDQERLYGAIVRAAGRGCRITVTNADHASVRRLYGVRGRYRRVPRYSLIAGLAEKRGATTEAVFTFNI